MLFELEHLVVCYDTAMILNEAGLKVNKGELVGLVGPNGAGKSTLLRAISGLVKWERDALKGTRAGNITLSGKVTFEGHRIDHLAAHEVAKKGLTLCPENGRPFVEMTVLENLKLGAALVEKKREVDENLETVYQLFPALKERHNQLSGTLSGGERQMLAIGRALMRRPKLLCIDEPSQGLAPLVKESLFERIGQIHDMGITILLIEQDISFVFDMADRNYILSRGRVIAEGTGDELLKDERIRQTYLGL